MITNMGTSPLWQLIVQADLISKTVLFLLLCMSMLCWSIFLCKFFLLRKKKRHLHKALSYIGQVNSYEDVKVVATQCTGTMPGHFLAYTMQSLQLLIDIHTQQGAGKLAITYWGQLQEKIYYGIDEMLYHEESGLWILSTSAGAATLLGLFGTIWGLVHAFVNISEKQIADITTVAPGIAEALMTTLAGLMVAIPALIMFNYMHMQLRDVEQQLLALAQRCNHIMQTMFM